MSMFVMTGGLPRYLSDPPAIPAQRSVSLPPLECDRTQRSNKVWTRSKGGKLTAYRKVERGGVRAQRLAQPRRVDEDERMERTRRLCEDGICRRPYEDVVTRFRHIHFRAPTAACSCLRAPSLD